jgi:hypothetical protein
MKLLVERKFDVYWCIGGGQGFGDCKALEKTFDTREEAEDYIERETYPPEGGRRYGWGEIEVRDIILKEIKG